MRWFRRIPRDLVIPEDSRSVETPIEGSSERTISDLFPVSAITASYPVIQSSTVTGTTYGALTYSRSNKSDGEDPTGFDSYTCRKIESIPNSRFCRLYFARVITDALAVNPFYTGEEFDPTFPWDPILYKVIFLIDSANPIVTRGPGGVEVYVNRYVPRAYYTDGQTGALIIQEHFVSDTPFIGVGDYDTPKPTTVQYEYANVRDTFRACLHNKLIFDTKQTAIVGYDAAAAVAVNVSGSVSGQIFEPTNFEEWQTHPFKFEFVQKGLLFEGIRYTAIAPEIPDTSLF